MSPLQDRDTVLFGDGAEAALASALAERGAERVLLIAQQRHTDGAERLQAALGDRAVGLFVTDRPQVPGEVADAAVAQARAAGADWLLAHGGGTVVGIAKAVALELPVQIAAVSTTYAGSERTNIWGLTRDGVKTTGRDDRVRPRIVAYDPALTLGLSVPFSIQSLLNAMAHAVEALYAADASEETRDAAAESLPLLVAGMRAVHADPTDLEGRAAALRGACLAGAALDGASMALHHKLAHVLGGSFQAPHALTHATLLPYTLGFNISAAPDALRRIQRALGTDDPPAFLYDLMRELGLKSSLKVLGLSEDDLQQVAAGVMQKQYANPRDYTEADILDLLRGGWHDRRPSLKTRRAVLQGATGVHAGMALSVRGAPVEKAQAVILAFHGRGACADRFLRDIEAQLPSTRRVTLIGAQAHDNAWYPKGYLEPVAQNQPQMDSALSVIDALYRQAVEAVGAERVILSGFSQGACLLLTWLAQTDARPAQVLAHSGAHTPLPGADFAAADAAHVFLSRSDDDPWIPVESFQQTVEALRARGGTVTVGQHPGDGHALHPCDGDAIRRAVEVTMSQDELSYQAGFGNTFTTEALPGALPRRQNTPRQVKYGLVTEQINGTGFTVERAQNRRTWMYRLRPQILARAFRPREGGRFTGDFSDAVPTPQVMRFKPQTMPTEPTDFIAGLTTFGGVGDPSMRKGAAVHLYAANKDMDDTAFSNIDGDLLVVPQRGRLHVRTELGRLQVAPGEILILPRGIRFQVMLPDGAARGWVGELFDGHFQLPERGPIGANGMASARHFLAPVADFEDSEVPWTVVVKQGGRLWEIDSPHSPFDVVAWHGNYAPFKYDLSNFNSLGSVSFDHVDPSILTVLTSPMDTHGRNAIDFGAFLGRWDVTETTFRPPYFHRNSAIEFNGVVSNTSKSGAWAPGTYTFTPYLTPHGISAQSYEATVTASDEAWEGPVRLSDESIWIQFESTYLMKVMPWMFDHDDRDEEYLQGFSGYRPGPELP